MNSDNSDSENHQESPTELKNSDEKNEMINSDIEEGSIFLLYY